MSPAAPREPLASDPGGPIALDGLVYGIELLDALVVFNLGDARVHASWVRPDGGLRAEDLLPALRDAFVTAQVAARRLAGPRSEPVAPVMTLELASRLAILRRIRGQVVAAVFEIAMPLGMARLIAARFAAALEPELPLGSEAAQVPEPPAPPKLRIPAPPAVGTTRSTNRWSEPAPSTRSFGQPAPPLNPAVKDRTARLLAYLEEHAPEPHVVRYRLALRAGLTLAALDRPEALGPEAIVLIETAVQDILGIDRAELRRIA